MSTVPSVNTGPGNPYCSILASLGVQTSLLLTQVHEGSAGALQVQLQLPQSPSWEPSSTGAVLEFSTGSTAFPQWQTASLGELTPGRLWQSPHVLLCVLAKAVLCWQSNRAIPIQQQMGLKPNSISACRHSRATRAITFHMLTKYVSRQSFLPKKPLPKASSV